MEITDLPAYKRLEEMFRQKGYSQGIKINMQIPNAYKDMATYIKAHISELDKNFYKNHIATNYYSLTFSNNDFEYMPLDFIDEEMVSCAMLRSINMRYVDRRGDCEDWFYSVYRRKPEVLTQDLYILGARCFAAKRFDENKFLDITPEKFRTPEFWFAMCLGNNTPVMEDIPKSILTNEFLVALLADSPENIKCFCEAALKREIFIPEIGNFKLWQITIIANGYLISDIPLNEERIDFFLSKYDKDSGEYEYGFKAHYKKYLRKKNKCSEPEYNPIKLAAITTLASASLGIDYNSAINLGNAAINIQTQRQYMLPIHCDLRVPVEYSKKYDKEEYLLEIYKKIGIQVLQEADDYYYNVIIPDNIIIVADESGYCIKDSNEKVLIHYYNVGPFYNLKIAIDQIYINL